MYLSVSQYPAFPFEFSTGRKPPFHVSVARTVSGAIIFGIGAQLIAVSFVTIGIRFAGQKAKHAPAADTLAFSQEKQTVRTGFLLKGSIYKCTIVLALAVDTAISIALQTAIRPIKNRRFYR